MYGIFAYIAGLAGAVLGGLLLKRWRRKQVLVISGLLMAVACAAWIAPSLGFKSPPLLYLLCGGFEFITGMAYIPLSTSMMDYSRPGSAGFDYTLQVSLVFVGSLIAGSMSGLIATGIGYTGGFASGAAIAVASTLLVPVVWKEDPARI